MKIALEYLLLIFLTGCVPYLEVGVGYARDTGNYYDIHNDGVVGLYSVGLQGKGMYCEYRHRSLLNKHPEVVTDDFVCMKRFEWSKK